MKALIIDDEPLARMVVKEYLQSYKEIGSVQECGDGFEGLKTIQQDRPDIIFLDIQMPKINGFEMLELVDDPPPHVIFTTAFDEYAIKAFEAHAVDYLLKPFSRERFDKAMQKLLSGKTAVQKSGSENLLEDAATSPVQRNRIVVKTGSKIKIIPVKDILFLEAADDYVKIHTAEGSYLKNKTMQHFESLLDSAVFVRTHRSYIINVQQVTRIDINEKDSHMAVLQSGAKIPVSKSGYVKLRIVLDV